MRFLFVREILNINWFTERVALSTLYLRKFNNVAFLFRFSNPTCRCCIGRVVRVVPHQLPVTIYIYQNLQESVVRVIIISIIIKCFKICLHKSFSINCFSKTSLLQVHILESLNCKLFMIFVLHNNMTLIKFQSLTMHK